ncbi:unnamed protein product, partial [Trichogramma brassicae]
MACIEQRTRIRAWLAFHLIFRACMHDEAQIGNAWNVHLNPFRLLARIGPPRVRTYSAARLMHTYYIRFHFATRSVVRVQVQQQQRSRLHLVAPDSCCAAASEQAQKNIIQYYPNRQWLNKVAPLQHERKPPLCPSQREYLYYMYNSGKTLLVPLYCDTSRQRLCVDAHAFATSIRLVEAKSSQTCYEWSLGLGRWRTRRLELEFLISNNAIDYG